MAFVVCRSAPERAGILRWPSDLCSKLMSCTQGEVRIAKPFTSSENGVGRSFSKNTFRVSCRSDQPHSTDGYATALADGLSQRHLIAGEDADVLVCDQPSA
jgi:hypothetical protein